MLPQQERLLVLSKQMELVYRQGDDPIRIRAKFHNKDAAENRNAFSDQWQFRSTSVIDREPLLLMSLYLPKGQSKTLFKRWEAKAEALAEQLCNWQGVENSFRCFGMLDGVERWIAAIFAFRRRGKTELIDHASSLEWMTTQNQDAYDRMMKAGVAKVIDDAVLESISVAGRLAEMEIKPKQSVKMPKATTNKNRRGRKPKKRLTDDQKTVWDLYKGGMSADDIDEHEVYDAGTAKRMINTIQTWDRRRKNRTNKTD